MKNDWSHILAYKLPAKKHEVHESLSYFTRKNLALLLQFRTEFCYTKPFLLWNVIDTDDFLTCKPFKLRAGQENLSEDFGLGGIVIGDIGHGISSSGLI